MIEASCDRKVSRLIELRIKHLQTWWISNQIKMPRAEYRSMDGTKIGESLNLSFPFHSSFHIVLFLTDTIFIFLFCQNEWNMLFCSHRVKMAGEYHFT